MNGTFTIISFDENGVRENEGKLRLVCNIEDDGKLALWGHEQNRHNIDAILNAGLPCRIECEYSEPAPWASTKFNHTHWVTTQARLEVLSV